MDFVLGAGDDRRTAELASHLEQIHQERGDSRSAERFGELRRRFQRAAGLTDAELAPAPAALAAVSEVPVDSVELAPSLTAPEFDVASEPAAPVDAAIEELEITPQSPATPERADEISASQPAAAQEMHEVDLSDEWASLLDGSAEAPVISDPTAPAHEGVAADDAVATPEISSGATHAPAESATVSEAAAAEVEEFSFGEDEPAQTVAAELTETPATALPLEVPEEGEFEIVDSSSAASPEHGAFAEISSPLPEPAETEPEQHELAESPAAPEVPEVAEISLGDPAPETPESLEDHLASLHLPGDAHDELPGHTHSQEPAEQPLELELDQDYELVLDAEPLVPAYDQKPPETPVVSMVAEDSEDSHAHEEISEHSAPAETVPAAANSFTADQFLADLASEMGEMGIGDLTPEFSQPAEPQAHAAARDSEEVAGIGHSAPLKEVFDEFRAELGEMGTEDEDLETHYNLGVAFREMGLLEEAISEFQKVAQACDRGRPFRYIMQCCTLLGLAFIEKGQPNMAAIWYERALQTPGLGPDNAMALRYDLGLAQESAGEHEAALKSFSHVYAMNIDYRDVAERISALQKPSR